MLKPLLLLLFSFFVCLAQENKNEDLLSATLKKIAAINSQAAKAGIKRSAFVSQQLGFYHRAVESLLTKNPEIAFNILQHCKGISFLSQFTEACFSIENKASPELVLQQNKVFQQIVTLKKFLKKIPITRNPQMKEQFQNQIREQKKKWQKINAKIHQENPAFSQLRYAKPITVSELQQILQPEEYFLEYFISQKNTQKIYCFLVGKHSFECLYLGEKAYFNFLLHQWLEALQQSRTLDASKYCQASLNFYQFYLAPLLSKIETAEKTPLSLIIANEFCWFPLGSLCLPENQKRSSETLHYQNLRYLTDQYHLSYTISATIYQQIKEFRSQSFKQKSKEVTFVGVETPYFETLLSPQGFDFNSAEFLPFSHQFDNFDLKQLSFGLAPQFIKNSEFVFSLWEPSNRAFTFFKENFEVCFKSELNSKLSDSIPSKMQNSLKIAQDSLRDQPLLAAPYYWACIILPGI